MVFIARDEFERSDRLRQRRGAGSIEKIIERPRGCFAWARNFIAGQFLQLIDHKRANAILRQNVGLAITSEKAACRRVSYCSSNRCINVAAYWKVYDPVDAFATNSITILPLCRPRERSSSTAKWQFELGTNFPVIRRLGEAIEEFYRALFSRHLQDVPLVLG